MNHSILVQKLDHYGIRGNALEWFQSYLTGRSQYVTVNGHVSNFLPITYGVPQGSMLRPLLFLIYVMTHLMSQRFGSFVFLQMIPVFMLTQMI